MSHTMEAPIVHRFRDVTVYLKFQWGKPNDESPRAALVVEDREISGYGHAVAELTGPWADYQSALEATILVADQWIDNHLSK